jgi:hypothetical protein
MFEPGDFRSLLIPGVRVGLDPQFTHLVISTASFDAAHRIAYTDFGRSFPGKEEIFQARFLGHLLRAMSLPHHELFAYII